MHRPVLTKAKKCSSIAFAVVHICREVLVSVNHFATFIYGSMCSSSTVSGVNSFPKQQSNEVAGKDIKWGSFQIVAATSKLTTEVHINNDHGVGR
jgi:hypothetical protein